MRNIILSLLLAQVFLPTLAQNFITTALTNRGSFYFIDTIAYPKHQKQLPIGVFDSGTGGLTVLNAIATFDKHNASYAQQADGISDFAKEKFIYLADQANMPYGNYNVVGKTDLLKEHILKDVQFMLGNNYYPSAQANHSLPEKQPVKVIVVACNTATAYGMETIRDFLKQAHLPIKVIGVIDAGCKGALATFAKNESGSIGIFATVGTVASNGYVRTLEKIKIEQGYTSEIQLYSRGGYGLAETIDEDPAFVNKNTTKPSQDYKGPSIDNIDWLIEKTLLKAYNFKPDGLLCNANKADDCTQMQLNSPENYVRFHLVSLLEQMRKNPKAMPLKTLILGCTHYPYVATIIEQVFAELRNYQDENGFPYKPLLAEHIQLIDPAVNTASELFDYLASEDFFNENADMVHQTEFFISVPNLQNPSVKTDISSPIRFTYDYKFGRNAHENQEYVKVIPFLKSNISTDILLRFRTQIPKVYEMIENFGKSNKLRFVSEADKIKE